MKATIKGNTENPEWPETKDEFKLWLQDRIDHGGNPANSKEWNDGKRFAWVQAWNAYNTITSEAGQPEPTGEAERWEWVGTRIPKKGEWYLKDQKPNLAKSDLDYIMQIVRPLRVSDEAEQLQERIAELEAALMPESTKGGMAETESIAYEED